MNHIRLEPIIIFNTISLCILCYHYNKKFVSLCMDRDLLQMRCCDLNQQIIELSKRIKFEIGRPKQVTTNDIADHMDQEAILRQINFK